MRKPKPALQSPALDCTGYVVKLIPAAGLPTDDAQERSSEVVQLAVQMIALASKRGRLKIDKEIEYDKAA